MNLFSEQFSMTAFGKQFQNLCSLDHRRCSHKPRLGSEGEGHEKLPSAGLASKLSRAAQLPLSCPGAPGDSDRAKRPPLASPKPTVEELNPGDRIEGLGNFGRPTGDVGTVEQTNEEDAVVNGMAMVK